MSLLSLICIIPCSNAYLSWRRLRKAAHLGLHLRAAEAYYPVEEREAAILVLDLLKEPNHWDDHLRRYAPYFTFSIVDHELISIRSIASTMFNVVYAGKPLATKDDPTVRKINDLMHRVVQAALPGRFLVEIIPWMRYLPDWMAKWKKEGKEWFQKDSTMFKTFLGDVRTQVVSRSLRLI